MRFALRYRLPRTAESVLCNASDLATDFLLLLVGILIGLTVAFRH